jgi:hypothetical protein
MISLSTGNTAKSIAKKKTSNEPCVKEQRHDKSVRTNSTRKHYIDSSSWMTIDQQVIREKIFGRLNGRS